MTTGNPQLPVFVCLKWGAGYPALYTNILYRALMREMSVPFRFVCLTDDATGLDDGIEALPIPEFALPREFWHRGMWPKLSVFKTGLFAPGTVVMMVDVDVVILRDLAPMVARVREKGGLHIIRDWPDLLDRWFRKSRREMRMSNSSVVGFIAGEQDHIFEKFRGAGRQELLNDWNDQNFIHRHAIDRRDWPEGWVLSFKKSLAWHFPLSVVLPVPRPKDAFIVAFHGKPDPEDLAGPPFRRWGPLEQAGFFPVKWVKSYWDGLKDRPA
ncbi:hypothetical protein HMH01_12815 [Halovulum dunhuangense]|uniref:Glycosyl transferase family 8 n=1 Tax=Halovulum dunhuangense TaxID=1505036 RepID=A0A849L560_9RHOB|nr:hypothetical protein [Halovulum dunhuangense]NNU81320.1 hypothetical protein [Halovulum dunhuangense]